MAENGETISFNSNGKAIIDGISLGYSVYDENKLSISFLVFAEEYQFNLAKDVLTLIDLSNNSKMIYYRNEEKQAEIRETLNKIKEERAEQEKLLQELKAQAQSQKDYEQYVSKLKTELTLLTRKYQKSKDILTIIRKILQKALKTYRKNLILSLN